MTNILPITHSFINSDSLSNIISNNWGLPKPIHSELLNRGMNDVYLIRDGKNINVNVKLDRLNESDVEVEVDKFLMRGE